MKAMLDNTTCTVSADRTRIIYLTEASTLGLKPGHWPGQIDSVPEIGNGQPFIRKRFHKTKQGDVTHAVYWQAFGTVELHVIND